MADLGSSGLKLLIVAPTIDRTDVGEAWVAYQWVSRLATRHDVTVLTYRKRDRPSPVSQLPGVRVVEWLDLPIAGRFERLNSMLKPGYAAFYVRARRWLRSALARGEQFDLVHQVVPVAMRYPSPAHGLGVPVVIGPVGGSLDNPEGFGHDGDTAPWYVTLRRLDRWRLRYDPLLRRTYDDAALVLTIAPYAAQQLRHRRVHRFEVMSETALEQLPPLERREASGEAVRLLYVGRIVRTKGLRDALRAIAAVETERRFTFDVIGDGFDRAMCEGLAQELGLQDIVRFHGRLPRPEVDAFYRHSDVFVFPSYREPGGNVLLEAMSYELAVITCDRGGPGAATTDECAIRLPVEAPDQLVRDLTAAITRLVDDDGLRRRLGQAGREHVAATALWDIKVDRASALYESVVGRSVGPGPLPSVV